MSEKSANELMQRYASAKGNWQNWRSIYDEAYAFTIPQKDPWPQEVAEGVRKNTFVYDITAVTSTRRLVSRLHASLFPPGEEWFELEAGEEVTDPNEKKQLNAILQVYTKIIFRALNVSNFDLVINELLQDICIGTGSMMILESDGAAPFKFKSVATDVVYPEGDAFDDIETTWRDMNKVWGHDIQTIWPKAKIPTRIAQTMVTDPMATFDFVEGVVWRPESMDYHHCVLVAGTKEYVVDEIVKSSPWIVARWSKASNEVGGRGPVLDAMPTIRSLNKLVEEILRNVALSTSPPWMAASDGVFNPHLFAIQPNKIIPISRQSMGELPLQKLDVSGDIRTGTLEVQDLRAQIKDALFDNPVRPIESPEQTATEIMIRQQQFAEEIGPAFGRLSVELSPRIIKRVVFILQKKGTLPNDLRIDNRSISIRYKSPLVRSSQVQDIQNLQNFNTILQGIVGPELSLGAMNLELVAPWLADKLNVDETLIKSSDEIMQMIQQAQSASQPPPAPGSGNPSPTQQLAQPDQNAQTQGQANAGNQ